MTGTNRFLTAYGPWALIAGASEGLGAAFARALARRGMNIVLIARRSSLMEPLGRECADTFGVHTRCVELDLAAPGLSERVTALVKELEIGLVVYNAAYAPVGQFTKISLSSLQLIVDVNIRGPIAVLNAALPSMMRRGRGGVVLMSSLAGNQGTPKVATYAASKAFNTVLAEGLWHELKASGVHVVACCAGAIRTPGYQGASTEDAPGTLDASDVAEAAVKALGRGPRVIPGVVNRIASVLLGRLLPRTAAIGIMAGSTRHLSTEKE